MRPLHMKRYLTREETAEYLGVSPRWFYTSKAAREIPFSRVGPKARYDREVLDEWMRQQRSTVGGA